MDDEKLKNRIGANIAAYRKRCNLTQAGLAARLNYSDKAVSKWERGESMPDVLTLVQLAEQFGVTVNDLLEDPDALPENSGGLEQAMAQMAEKTLKRKANKSVILMLSALLVWFVALLVFVMCESFDVPYSWVSFVYAIPITAIVLLSLRSAWRDFRWNRALISVIMWGCLVCIHISFLVFLKFDLWRIYLLGILGQAAILLWFRLFYNPKKAENPPREEENG